jgi:hypothetical protein
MTIPAAIAAGDGLEGVARGPRERSRVGCGDWTLVRILVAWPRPPPLRTIADPILLIRPLS